MRVEKQANRQVEHSLFIVEQREFRMVFAYEVAAKMADAQEYYVENHCAPAILAATSYGKTHFIINRKREKVLT